jgi:hypothetical protein
LFTYADYVELIHTFKDNNLWIRHDIDFSINKALQFAEFEATLGIKSMYYVLANGLYYNPYQQENIQKLKMIRELGHAIALHFDLTSLRDADPETQSNNIQAHRALLEYSTISEINYITFHKPLNGVQPTFELLQELNKVELYYPDSNRAYKYISDSGSNWREDPKQVALEYPNVQLNTHPVWWAENEGDWESRVHDLKLDVELDKNIIKEINSVRAYREKLLSQGKH